MCAPRCANVKGPQEPPLGALARGRGWGRVSGNAPIKAAASTRRGGACVSRSHRGDIQGSGNVAHQVARAQRAARAERTATRAACSGNPALPRPGRRRRAAPSARSTRPRSLRDWTPRRSVRRPRALARPRTAPAGSSNDGASSHGGSDSGQSSRLRYTMWRQPAGAQSAPKSGEPIRRHAGAASAFAMALGTSEIFAIVA